MNNAQGYNGVCRDDGFTMIEVLVAITLFSIVIAGIGPAMIGNVSINKLMEAKTGAIHAAQLVMDDIRVQDVKTLPSSGAADPVEVTVGERVYQVVAHYCEDSTYCDTDTRAIRASVTHKSRMLYEVQTIYTSLR